MTRRPLSLLALTIAATAWVAALLWAPALRQPPTSALAPVFTLALYGGGAVICHQKPERSFTRAGVPLPVCARCFGLYLGGLLGVVAWVSVGGMRRRVSARGAGLTARPTLPRTLLVLLAVPTAVTLITAWTGVWDPGNLVRAVSAVPLGAAAGGITAAAAAGDLR